MRSAGIEPAPDACFWYKVRDTRIELVPQPWEGRILPLNQSRTLNQNLGTKIACYAILEVLPLNYDRNFLKFKYFLNPIPETMILYFYFCPCFTIVFINYCYHFFVGFGNLPFLSNYFFFTFFCVQF